jgi:hypothetical protein
MKVYVVETEVYDGWERVGVFSTRELADTYVLTMQLANMGERLSVSEEEVDAHVIPHLATEPS